LSEQKIPISSQAYRDGTYAGEIRVSGKYAETA